MLFRKSRTTICVSLVVLLGTIPAITHAGDVVDRVTTFGRLISDRSPARGSVAYIDDVYAIDGRAPQPEEQPSTLPVPPAFPGQRAIEPGFIPIPPALPDVEQRDWPARTMGTTSTQRAIARDGVDAVDVPDPTRQAGGSLTACPENPDGDPIFDWSSMPADPYDMPSGEEQADPSTIDKARAFLRAGFLPEARLKAGAILASTSRDETAAVKSEARAVVAATRLLQGQSIQTPLFDQLPWCRSGDAPVWRALNEAVTPDVSGIAEAPSDIAERIAALPRVNARKAGLMLAQDAVDAGQRETAIALLKKVANWQPTGVQKAAVNYLRGRMAADAGDMDRARELWQQGVSLSGATNPPFAAARPVVLSWLRVREMRADTAIAVLAGEEQRDDAGGLTPEKARERLEIIADDLAALAYDWRGTDVENRFMRLKHRVFATLDRRREFLADLKQAVERAGNTPRSAVSLSREEVASWAADAIRARLDKEGLEKADWLRRLSLFERYGALARGSGQFAEIALDAADLYLQAELPARAARAARSAQKAAAVDLDQDTVARSLRLMVRANLRSGDVGVARDLSDRLSTSSDKNLRLLADVDEAAGTPERAARRLERLSNPGVDDRIERARLLWKAERWADAAEVYGTALGALTDEKESGDRTETLAYKRVAAMTLAGNAPADSASAFPGLDASKREKLMQVDRIAALVGTQADDGDTPARTRVVRQAIAEAETVMQLPDALATGSED